MKFCNHFTAAILASSLTIFTLGGANATPAIYFAAISSAAMTIEKGDATFEIIKTLIAEDRYADALKLAMENGETNNHARSSFVAGALYEAGLGAEQSWVDAEKWLRKSAESGLPEAQFNLATYLYDGRPGVPANQAEAIKWFKKAAAQDMAVAKQALIELNIQ